MRLSGFLKTEQRFAAVLTVGVAAGEEFGLGDPNAVFVSSHLNFSNWNNHYDTT